MDEHSSFYSSLAFLAKPMSVKILPSNMPSGVFQICILAAFISVIIVGEPQVANGQHGLDHPAVVIDFPSLECACDDSNASSTSSDREQGGDESSRGGTCKAGGQARWVLSVRGLVPGFSYRLHFRWSLADEQIGAFDSVISTVTSSYVARKPLTDSGQNGNFTFDLIAHSRKLRMDVAVWDVYPGLSSQRTEEEAMIGARHMDSAINTVRVRCTEFESDNVGEHFTVIDHYRLREIRATDAAALCVFYNKGLGSGSKAHFHPLGQQTDDTTCMHIASGSAGKSYSHRMDLVIMYITSASSTNSDGRIVGWAFWSMTDRGTSIGIAVADAQQGRGLGKKLMQALIQKAEEKQLSELILRVYSDNDHAIAMYHNFGFKIESTLKGSTGKQEHIMRLILPQR